MIKFLTLVALVTFRIGYQPAAENSNSPAFSRPGPHATALQLHIMRPARLISFKANVNDKKVVLQWEISQNASADLFEIQKSNDGKNFSMAALVFGTDSDENGNYAFYEKASGKQISYRIKIIGKDKQVSFSDIVIVKPLAS